MTKKQVTKAVFPVGGLGTRFLPATKVMPKEMLPVANKPLVQYVFEEAQMAGINQHIFITGRNKNTIMNHFDHSYELQQVLSEKAKQQELELTKGWLPNAGEIAFIRQLQPLGLGHAVWCARNFITDDEPFAVLLADEMLKVDGGFLKQMKALYEQTQTNIIALSKVAPHETSKYGIIIPGEINGNIVEIKGMVEKPKPEDAPSCYAITGRYILSPEIFGCIEQTQAGANNEIQLTDAMCNLLKKQKFFGLVYEGPRFDCGSNLGFLEANIAYSLEDSKNNEEIKRILKKYV